MTNFSFNIIHKSKKNQSRLGIIKTPHGEINTPAFIFCATKAAMKGISPAQMKEEHTQIILSNTYHLMLQPGGEIIEKLGGLHKFMGWNGPMLTDSGGFQIFSLGHGSISSEIKGKKQNNRPKTLLNITEEGATFKSYIDGKKHILTPEKSIQLQQQLGADLILVLDECTPFHVDKQYTEKSMELSHRWALRCLKEFKKNEKNNQALYGIVQGGIYPELRTTSADFVNSNKFFGSAIGGSLGANKNQMYDIIAHSTKLLDPSRPIHLLGIGNIDDIFKGAIEGIDTFDCVHPTRLARHGGALTKLNKKNHINLQNSKFRKDPTPIDKGCTCYTCKNHSRAYLHHLIKAKELLVFNLITIHNVHFMNKLLHSIRKAIKEDKLEEEYKIWVNKT